MSKKRKKPKWAKTIVPGKRTLNSVATSMIKYMELAKAARKYLEATRRFNPKLDFRLYSEIEFCAGALIHFFGVTESFIMGAQKVILGDKEGFEKDVKDFCESISPEKPLIVTDNMEAEMNKIIQRDKLAKNKGRIII